MERKEEFDSPPNGSLSNSLGWARPKQESGTHLVFPCGWQEINYWSPCLLPPRAHMCKELGWRLELELNALAPSGMLTAKGWLNGTENPLQNAVVDT